VQYDGSNDGLFSLRKQDETGAIMIFQRSFCDMLLSFVYNSRSSYAAATNFLASLRPGYNICRQNIVLLGRAFVATLEPAPDLFVCPKCGDNPRYVVIDGQAVGFKMRSGLEITRPALHLPNLGLNTNKYALLREPTLRAAVRKTIRTGDPLNKTDEKAIKKFSAARLSIFPRNASGETIEVWRLKRASATVFFHFFPHTSTATEGLDTGKGGRAAASGHTDASAAGSDPSASDGGPASAARRGQAGGAPRPRRSKVNAASDAASPWYTRKGLFSPSFSKAAPSSTEWATARPFLLGFLGDPVVNLFQGQDRDAIKTLADALSHDDGRRWHDVAAAANAVGFVANFLARHGEDLAAIAPLRTAVGKMIEFGINVDEKADQHFQAAAEAAAAAGRPLTKEYCEQWKGRPTPEDYKKFAAEHPDFVGKDLDSPFTCYEYFGYLQRVRPAIFTPRVKIKRRRQDERRRRRGVKGSQADAEDPTDRCSKSFPKHPDLTAGVFNVVCPHVVTMGFRVMFQAESVADALSVILERFPQLPKVVFYDVACKMDRNAMQRVRSILSAHNVRFCLDRVHAKGHTCSCIYFPDEVLSVTSGVSTQAAEVQHSISVKFRSHLAYMSPASFMAHRIAQLSFMNLTAAYKIKHPDAKAENDGVRLNAFYYGYRNVTCKRRNCTCPAAAEEHVALTTGAAGQVGECAVTGAPVEAGGADVEAPALGEEESVEQVEGVDSMDSMSDGTTSATMEEGADPTAQGVQCQILGQDLGGGAVGRSPVGAFGSSASGAGLGRSPATGCRGEMGDVEGTDVDVFMEE